MLEKPHLEKVLENPLAVRSLQADLEGYWRGCKSWEEVLIKGESQVGATRLWRYRLGREGNQREASGGV